MLDNSPAMKFKNIHRQGSAKPNVFKNLITGNARVRESGHRRTRQNEKTTNVTRSIICPRIRAERTPSTQSSIVETNSLIKLMQVNPKCSTVSFVL